MRRIILFLTVIFITFGSAVWVVWQDKILNRPVQPNNTTTPTMTIQHITLKQREKKNGLDVLITAQEGIFNQNSDDMQCKHVVFCLGKKNSTLAQLGAQASCINRRTKIIDLQGPIRGFLKDIALRGSDVTLNFSTQMATTDHSLTYTHPNFTLIAQHSQIDLKEQQIKMSGVWSQFYIARQPTTAVKDAG
jgi:LPS export ABC transporter protein LptC